MKKIKDQKGITLIALIITIIVLLILAVVTIGTIQESNVITYAQNAANDYNKEKEKEESTISGYESLIEQYVPQASKIEYYIVEYSSNTETSSVVQKLDSNNLVCTTYFVDRNNGEYVMKAATQLESYELIAESITINDAWNDDTGLSYSVELQPGTKVYYINVEGQSIPGIYITDDKFYGLNEHGYMVFNLVTDERKISEIEAGISKAE